MSYGADITAADLPKKSRKVPPPSAPSPGSIADTDAMLRQFQNGLSAPPEPPMVAGGAMAPAVSGAAPTRPPAPTTTLPGWSGIMDIYRQAGALTPGQYQSEADKILKQIGAANQGAITGIEQNVQKRDALMGQSIARPAPPHLQPVPQAPDTTMKNPLQVFKNSAAILGMLGSLFTRKPLVTAMNSASAAIKGYAEGDAAAAERAHKSWKDSLEAAVAQNQVEMDQYNALLQDTQLSMAERTAQLQAIAASNNDQNMLAALRSGEPQMAFQILDGRQKAAQSLTGMLIQAQQYEQSMAMDRARLGETQRHNQAMEGGLSAGGGPLDLDTVQMLAQQYLGGDRTALMGLGYGRQGMQARQQVLTAASQIVKSQGGQGGDIAANRATYESVKSALRNTTNYVNRATIAENTFLKNLEIVQKTMSAGVGGSPSPLVNRWINSTREQILGDPDLKAFDIAINTAAREYARIVTGAVSNAMLTDSAREESKHMLDTMLNPDQIKAAVDVMKQDVQNAIEANKEQMQDMQRQLEEIGDVPAGAAGAGASGATGETDIKEGDILEQDGHHYRYTNGKYEPVD